eukprot:13682729-Alexandrium_andersonii.AAC.1
MKELQGYTQEGEGIGMEMQTAEVKKALGSARRMCEAGSRMVFEEAGSYIEHKASEQAHAHAQG